VCVCVWGGGGREGGAGKVKRDEFMELHFSAFQNF
jgi:hypothetical protein